MHIFIDESGTFVVPTDARSSPCVVGAVVVPDYKIEQLFAKYATMRQRLPTHKGEVKGSQLDEAQVAGVVNLLRKNHCLFEFAVVDMGKETNEQILRRRSEHAKALTSGLTNEHPPHIVEIATNLERRLAVMAPQLFVQSLLMNKVISRVLRNQTVYWLTHRPHEALNYRWLIDGKEVAEATPAESWWQQTKDLFLQTQLATDRIAFPEGLSLHTYDAKFRMPIPPYMRQDLGCSDDETHGYNLGLMLSEHFAFSGAAEFGLELADILTNALRRALRGSLGLHGWGGIPSLMIWDRDGIFSHMALSGGYAFNDLPYAAILDRHFRCGGRFVRTPKG